MNLTTTPPISALPPSLQPYLPPTPTSYEVTLQRALKGSIKAQGKILAREIFLRRISNSKAEIQYSLGVSTTLDLTPIPHSWRELREEIRATAAG